MADATNDTQTARAHEQALAEQAMLYVERDPLRPTVCFPRATLSQLAGLLDAAGQQRDAALADAARLREAIAAHRATTEFGRQIIWDNAPLSEVPHIPKDVDLWDAAGLDVTAERAALRADTDGAA